MAAMSNKTRDPVSAAQRMQLLRHATSQWPSLCERDVTRHGNRYLDEKGVFDARAPARPHAAIENAIGEFICYVLGPQGEQA